MINAKIEFNKVKCGECGATLMLIEVPNKGEKVVLELKCNHRTNGKSCKTINKVVL